MCQRLESEVDTTSHTGSIQLARDPRAFVHYLCFPVPSQHQDHVPFGKKDDDDLGEKEASEGHTSV